MSFKLNFNTVSFVLILVSFVFLILATVSTPIGKSFDLASTVNFRYGIFGYCSVGTENCLTSYPYMVGSVDKNADWVLSSATRNQLAKIFIICPIAAGINLITLILVFVSHFVENKVLIFCIVFNVLSFVVTTLITVIVILVFHPNVAWTGWILPGAAAADLISIVFLFLSLKFRHNTDVEFDDSQDLTTFDDKFGHVEASTFGTAPNKFFNNTTIDTSSSISKDYEFKVQAPPQRGQMTKTLSNSSVYNSNPQVAKDFTLHNGHSAVSIGQKTSSSSYEDSHVNLVNGPNTSIFAKQQMAPNLVPTVATPTSNDVPTSNIPQLPYPSNNRDSSSLNKHPYSGNMSVFEHHPEVEGHKPFTELDDDEPTTSNHQPELDSDDDSDFTSVSQRAPNPIYYPQSNNGNQSYFPLPQGNYPYQQYPHAQQYQPQYQQKQSSPLQQQNPQFYQTQPQDMSQAPQKSPYVHPIRPQQRQPTISDSVLSNNPDFALGLNGSGNRRKQFGPPVNRPNNQRYNQSPSLTNRNGMSDKSNGLRDGPYGMLH